LFIGRRTVLLPILGWQLLGGIWLVGARRPRRTAAVGGVRHLVGVSRVIENRRIPTVLRPRRTRPRCRGTKLLGAAWIVHVHFAGYRRLRDERVKAL
jgi:hypothetical protein